MMAFIYAVELCSLTDSAWFLNVSISTQEHNGLRTILCTIFNYNQLQIQPSLSDFSLVSKKKKYPDLARTKYFVFFGQFFLDYHKTFTHISILFQIWKTVTNNFRLLKHFPDVSTYLLM